MREDPQGLERRGSQVEKIDAAFVQQLRILLRQVESRKRQLVDFITEAIPQQIRVQLTAHSGGVSSFVTNLVETGQASHSFENRGMEHFGGREAVRGHLEAIQTALAGIAEVTIEESEVIAGGFEFGAKLKE